jgi:hypothetical protein
MFWQAGLSSPPASVCFPSSFVPLIRPLGTLSPQWGEGVNYNFSSLAAGFGGEGQGEGGAGDTTFVITFH